MSAFDPGDLQSDGRSQGQSAGDPVLRAWHAALRYNEIEQHDRALRALDEGLSAAPRSPQLKIERGRTLHLLERHAEAEEELREALALDPESSEARGVLGWVLLQLGRYVECEQVLLEALRRDPDDPELLRGYGVLLYQSGELHKAEKVIRRALAVTPESHELHNVLTMILTAQRRNAAARTHAETGLGLDPGAQGSHLAAGLAAFQGGRPFAAREHLRVALRSDGSPEVRETFEEIDRLTRWPILPYYFYSLLIDRLPGKQFAIWIAFCVLVFGGRALGIPGTVTLPLGLAYLLLCIYTWFADPLSRLWVRMFPPR